MGGSADIFQDNTRFTNGFFQFIAINRFEQIINTIHFEGADGVFVFNNDGFYYINGIFIVNESWFSIISTGRSLK